MQNIFNNLAHPPPPKKRSSKVEVDSLRRTKIKNSARKYDRYITYVGINHNVNKQELMWTCEKLQWTDHEYI